jgi:YggT family protein
MWRLKRNAARAPQNWKCPGWGDKISGDLCGGRFQLCRNGDSETHQTLMRLFALPAVLFICLENSAINYWSVFKEGINLFMLIRLIQYLFQLAMLLIIARVIVSWLPVDRNHSLLRLLYQFTEPILRPFRFARLGMIDFSPILALVLIQLLNEIVITGLTRIFL